MGCMLPQQDPESKRERAIYYISKKMLEYEQKYTFLEKNCLALVWATQKLRHCLLSNRKSIKGRMIAEQLADSPAENNEFLKAEFRDEEIMTVEDEIPDTKWLMYFDGAVNNRGQGVGAVLVSPRKEYIPISIKPQFKCTNNMAEYEACITGLEAAIALRIQDLDLFRDSILIICQINGNWKTRDDKLIPYNTYLESLPLEVRLQWAPAHVNAIEIAARCSDGKPWYTDIKDFISGKGHPPEALGKERRSLQKLASNFVICGEELSEGRSMESNFCV
ncbi:uncharacterized protein LOC143867723 [Tasmannia lanceolata]|uniref:uncharacterized protein LOC143867723 n=1 Tax=Tasmannia lanceolata TaxID=3420 RepID=UPI004063F4B6